MKRMRILTTVLVVISAMALISGCHSRWGNDDFPERALERLDDRIEDLQLSNAQQDQYQSLRTRLEEDLEKMKADQIKFRDEFRKTVDRDGVPITDITGLVREKSTEIVPMVSKLMDYVEEFYGILDQTQQEKLMKEFRDRLDSRHWH